MRGPGPHIICFHEQVVRQLVLHSEAPLLRIRAGIVRVGGVDMEILIIDCIGIEERCREAAIQWKYGLQSRGREGNIIVDERRRIFRELILAARAIKGHIENTVSTPQHCLGGKLISYSETGSEVELLAAVPEPWRRGDPLEAVTIEPAAAGSKFDK